VESSAKTGRSAEHVYSPLLYTHQWNTLLVQKLRLPHAKIAGNAGGQDLLPTENLYKRDGTWQANLSNLIMAMLLMAFVLVLGVKYD
jgi:hypothetical protein